MDPGLGALIRKARRPGVAGKPAAHLLPGLLTGSRVPALEDSVLLGLGACSSAGSVKMGLQGGPRLA